MWTTRVAAARPAPNPGPNRLTQRFAGMHPVFVGSKMVASWEQSGKQLTLLEWAQLLCSA